MAGKDVLLSLQEAGVPHDEPFIFTDPDLYSEWTYVEQLKARLSETDAIPIAVGSGVINDLTKYVAFLLGRRYMTVGTAASMDGYTAYGSSITIDGNKQTVDCPAPYGFVMDPVIAAEAPKELAASGYGDLIANHASFYIALTAIVLGPQFFLAGFLGDLISRQDPQRNNYQIEEEL